MFKNKTAWFSNSVKRGIRSVWVREGGLIVSWKRASYLFSDDATCPDTDRVFTSREYMEGKLTVFHSAFISVCDVRQSMKSVAIGHYVLPPIPVQEEVKAVIGRFIWEEDNLTEGPEEEALEEGPEPQKQKGHRKDGSASKQKSENGEEVLMSLDELLMATGKEEEETQEEQTCCGVQHYPVNNMLSGYVGSEQLKRYGGELHDFLPGRSGFSVSVRSRRRHRNAAAATATDRTQDNKTRK